VEKGISSIEAQANKLFKHTRQGSYLTRQKYARTSKAFCRWVAENFKLQNLRNLSDKHIVAYIQHRQEEGKAPATIQTELSAIRFLHDQLPNPRHELSDTKSLRENYGLQLEAVSAIKGDRAWTEQEFQDFKGYCIENGRQDTADIMTLCRHLGLRATEAVAIKRSQAEYALRNGFHKVGSEAKNGKIREVPLTKEAKEILERKMQETSRGEKLFIKNHEKTHHVINRHQAFIKNHRSKIETREGSEQRTWKSGGEPRQNELTLHGLRYSYIQQRLDQEMKKGLRKLEAKQAISKEIGHERPGVTDIYTGGK